MTVEELIMQLQSFPPTAPVKVFEAMDSNGPNTWEEPKISLVEDGSVHVEMKL